MSLDKGHIYAVLGFPLSIGIFPGGELLNMLLVRLQVMGDKFSCSYIELHPTKTLMDRFPLLLKGVCPRIYARVIVVQC